MATESFFREIIIDNNSEKCVNKILNEQESKIINVKNNCILINKEQLRKIFELDKEKTK